MEWQPAGPDSWEAKFADGGIATITLSARGATRFKVSVSGRCSSIAHGQARVEALVDRIGLGIESPKAEAATFVPGG
ncbi:hypothetical protein [Roseiarcus sp.]|uniref:hypothetical protein n=1 Tax=Roseiarcus sp. TaxID=1969460 RepID=UPI003F9BDDB6